MRAFLATIAVVVVVSPAHAGTFGGFSADERSFLRGRDQICSPLPPASGKGGLIECRNAAADEIARHEFRRGILQRGAGATYRADIKGGTAVRLFSIESGKCQAAWSSLDPVSSITAVHLSRGGRLIAVELETRVGGHLRSLVIVFALPAAAIPAPPPDTTVGDDSPAPQPLVAPTAAQKKAIAAALSKARRLAKKRAHKRALAAYRQLLSLDHDHPEARYGAAVALMGLKRAAEAIAELAELAGSGHPEAVVWMVEARSARVFARLLGDKRFRRAVALDHDGSRTITAYERLVGLGGHWEQPGVSCDTPKVNLKLQRKVGKFTLRLTSTCQGMRETTRLDGRWSATGSDLLGLTFPNVEGADEVISCQLSTCGDGSGEDCLTCAPGSDMEMLLRLVRR